MSLTGKRIEGLQERLDLADKLAAANQLLKLNLNQKSATIHQLNSQVLQLQHDKENRFADLLNQRGHLEGQLDSQQTYFNAEIDRLENDAQAYTPLREKINKLKSANSSLVSWLEASLAKIARLDKAKERSNLRLNGSTGTTFYWATVHPGPVEVWHPGVESNDEVNSVRRRSTWTGGLPSSWTSPRPPRRQAPHHSAARPFHPSPPVKLARALLKPIVFCCQLY